MINCKKNILLISHPRAGLHFTLNSIADNWNYNKDRILVPPVNDVTILEKFFRRHNSIDHIFKSHHSFDVLESMMPMIIKRFKVIYIIRDGRDVMTSLFFFFQNYKNHLFPHCKDILSLMSENPNNWKMGGKYDFGTFSNYVERWVDHTSKWYDYYCDTGNIELIRYEDLCNKIGFYGTICRLGSFFNTKPKLPITKPTVKDVGVFNRKGIVGDHKNHFKKEDYDFFNYYAKDNMIKLRYFI